MIGTVLLIKDEDFLRDYSQLIGRARSAVSNGDPAIFEQARVDLISSSERVAPLLGSRNIFLWKPPGQPMGVGIPRELLAAYLQALAEEPHDQWTQQLEGMLGHQLLITFSAVAERRRRYSLLILFPPYWPFGMAGLAVAILAFMLEASRLVPRSVLRSTPALAVARGIQWLVTGLELWGFYKLLIAGQLF